MNDNKIRITTRTIRLKRQYEIKRDDLNTKCEYEKQSCKCKTWANKLAMEKFNKRKNNEMNKD